MCRNSDSDSALCLAPEAQDQVVSLVLLLCSQMAHPHSSIPATRNWLPPVACVRCIVAFGALVAAVLAEGPIQEVPPGGGPLLASAFDIGFNVGRCLQRPPDLEQQLPTLEQGGAQQSDTDDLFAELVDEVQEWWFGMLPHLTVLVKRGPKEGPLGGLLQALHSKRSVQQLLDAKKEMLQAMVGNSLTASSPVSPLLEALRAAAA